jgi:hypothetical protein
VVTRRIAAIALLAAGCGGVPDASPPRALVRSDGADSAHCGPGSSPICEARVVGVDGERVFAGDAVAVEPGTRRLTVYCRFNVSIMIGDSQAVERVLAATLEPSRRYRIEARMSPQPCSVALIDETTGRAIAGSD